MLSQVNTSRNSQQTIGNTYNGFHPFVCITETIISDQFLYNFWFFVDLPRSSQDQVFLRELILRRFSKDQKLIRIWVELSDSIISWLRGLIAYIKYQFNYYLSEECKIECQEVRTQNKADKQYIYIYIYQFFKETIKVEDKQNIQ